MYAYWLMLANNIYSNSMCLLVCSGRTGKIVFA